MTVTMPFLFSVTFGILHAAFERKREITDSSLYTV